MRSTDHRYCYHCGQPHKAGLAYSITLRSEQRAMCCTGCQLVAALIAQCETANSSEQPDNPCYSGLFGIGDS
jgi:Cu2+-exporting ATPase